VGSEKPKPHCFRFTVIWFLILNFYLSSRGKKFANVVAGGMIKLGCVEVIRLLRALFHGNFALVELIMDVSMKA